MRASRAIVIVLSGLGFAATSGLCAGPEDWYYKEGPLRGSLRSDRALPLYDSDPEHLWNRLFAVFYIRPSELASRPEYPADPIRLAEWDRKLQQGKLGRGPVVKRIEGGDVPNLLAWPKTRYFSSHQKFEQADKLLEEFLAGHGEQLIADPLKRTFLQRDLWAVFDHLAGQGIARYGNADLARRRAVVRDYEIQPDELEWDDPQIGQRRRQLCRKLAAVIQRLALPEGGIRALPDNYQLALGSGAFTDGDELNCGRNYLPSGLLSDPNEWVEIDNETPSSHHDRREGQMAMTTWSIRGRSYHRIFWRFPGGRPAVEEYLRYLQREGVDWEASVRQGFIALKDGARQIPAGTQTAIVQFMIALNEELKPVPSRVVELVHLNVYKNMTGQMDPQTNTGRGMICRQYVVRRRLLLDGLKQGGLERQADDMPTYRTLLEFPQDWGSMGRQRSVVQTCMACHISEKDRHKNQVGVFSLNSVFCFVSERGMPGVVIPMGSGEVKAYSRAERTVRWKLGQEDYLRLVEWAAAAKSKPGG